MKFHAASLGEGTHKGSMPMALKPRLFWCGQGIPNPSL